MENDRSEIDLGVVNKSSYPKIVQTIEISSKQVRTTTKNVKPPKKRKIKECDITNWITELID